MSTTQTTTHSQRRAYWRKLGVSSNHASSGSRAPPKPMATPPPSTLSDNPLVDHILVHATVSQLLCYFVALNLFVSFMSFAMGYVVGMGFGTVLKAVPCAVIGVCGVRRALRTKNESTNALRRAALKRRKLPAAPAGAASVGPAAGDGIVVWRRSVDGVLRPHRLTSTVEIWGERTIRAACAIICGLSCGAQWLGFRCTSSTCRSRRRHDGERAGCGCRSRRREAARKQPRSPGGRHAQSAEKKAAAKAAKTKNAAKQRRAAAVAATKRRQARKATAVAAAAAAQALSAAAAAARLVLPTVPALKAMRAARAAAAAASTAGDATAAAAASVAATSAAAAAQHASDTLKQSAQLISATERLHAAQTKQQQLQQLREQILAAANQAAEEASVAAQLFNQQAAGPARQESLGEFKESLLRRFKEMVDAAMPEGGQHTTGQEQPEDGQGGCEGCDRTACHEQGCSCRHCVAAAAVQQTQQDEIDAEVEQFRSMLEQVTVHPSRPKIQIGALRIPARA